MDRRTFLTSIGLGGLALTIPKPLSVVAAKLSDLKDPPIYAGHTSFKIDRPFVLYDLYWNYPVNYPAGIEHPSIRDYNLFTHGTTVSLFSRGTRIMWEQLPTSHIPSAREWGEAVKPKFGWGISLPPGEEVELWCVPRLTSSGEHGKLLPVDWTIQGLWKPSDKHSGFQAWYFVNKMKLVRIERDRAIELGLASPEEPEETWV